MTAPKPEHDGPFPGETVDRDRDRPAPGDAGPRVGEEPVATGTLFIMILFLMALAGMWGIMYLILLER